MKTPVASRTSPSAVSLGLSGRPCADGFEKVRVGVIECGGRGSRAATNCLEAGDGVAIVAIADASRPGR